MSLYAALGKGAELGVAAVSKQLHEGVTKRRLGCWTLLELGRAFSGRYATSKCHLRRTL